MPRTLIIGAGWSGLACAYKLTQKGYQVTIIEAAGHPGGRARSASFGNYTVDNGQHICIGAYKNLLSLLEEIGISEKQAFSRIPSKFYMIGDKKLTLIEKFRAFRFIRKLQKVNFTDDCSVSELLDTHQQSDRLKRCLWEPLTLAALTTHPSSSSAKIFINILRDTFGVKKSYSDWLLPTTDLSSLFPTKVEDYLQKNGSNIEYLTSANALELKNGKISAAISKKGSHHADHVVLATPAWRTAQMIKDLDPKLANSLLEFEYQNITTAYLVYAEPVALPYPIIGSLNTTSQWIFDRSFANQPNMISVVVSASTESNLVLQDKIIAEISNIFPHLPKPQHVKIITEKRAAFDCTVKAQKLRPKSATRISNLWITGDYLDNGYPSTLEGAIINGIRTAKDIASL